MPEQQRVPSLKNLPIWKRIGFAFFLLLVAATVGIHLVIILVAALRGLGIRM